MGDSTETVKLHISSGAVVYRRGDDGSVQFLVMHRNESDTWHLPKGTQQLGETLEETALREVLEETGYTIQLRKELGSLDSTFKRDGRFMLKRTHYFLAMTDMVTPAPHDREHDEVVFLPFEQAYKLLKEHTWHEEEWIPLERAKELLKA